MIDPHGSAAPKHRRAGLRGQTELARVKAASRALTRAQNAAAGGEKQSGRAGTEQEACEPAAEGRGEAHRQGA